MCSSKPPPAQTPAAAVPLPAEAVKPAVVETAGAKPKKSGRSGLMIPEGSASVTGLSGLNIPT
ncbi:hypothetical protein GmRootV15_27040 [Variovorax sp. V15]